MDFTLCNYSNTSYFTLCDTQTYARLVDIHDGDTITLVIFIFNHPFKFHVRLAGIDTCEINNKNSELKLKAMQARNRVLQLATNNTISSYTNKKDIIQELDNQVYLLWIECLDFDKFGRVLANVYTSQDKQQCFSTILLEEHLAYPYQGKTKLSEKEQLIYLNVFNESKDESY